MFNQSRMRAIAMMLTCLGTGPARGAFRPPAVPLVTHDPYFSCWSMADHLYDDWTRHWTGANHAMAGIVRVDGVPMRFMGGANAQPAAATQTSVTVTATQSRYVFSCRGVELTVTFTSPLLPNDLDVLTRPASYVTFTARSADGKRHAVQLYFDISAEWVVDQTTQSVTWSRLTIPGLDVMQVGSVDQNILAKSGDNLRIDWGRLMLSVRKGQNASTSIVSADDARARFSADGALPAPDDTAKPRPAKDRWPVMTALFDLGSVTGKPVRRHVTVAYDDVYGIEYFGAKLRGWWRRDASMTPERMVAAAESDYETLIKRCDAFDAALNAEAARAGGARYAQLCALAYRQTIAGNKVVAGPDGQPLCFAKENFSNGCIATVDVMYPSAPFFLRYSPALLEAQLSPIFAYARGGKWPFPFAPHDLGTYPKANGQVYGLVNGELKLEFQMPVEETGNMLILTAALCKARPSPEFATRNWDLLSKWADYLVANALDPGNQLCTADMFGPLAHNTDLALKGIIGIGAYARLCAMTGKPDEARKYSAIAREYAAQWRQKASDTGHTRLAYDKPGTWSMKHNLIWDRVLGTNLFPVAVGDSEAAWYLKTQGAYGLPVDNRTPTSLIDWNLWCAALAKDKSDFEALVAPLYRYANETPSRVPLCDWFDTTTARQTGFQARSVVGGLFIKMLRPPAEAEEANRAGREGTKPARNP
ncbi:MAG TPA: DUF5127 domain-containing protein [Armatimonadota bacterium]|jgi:hypothetical protein